MPDSSRGRSVYVRRRLAGCSCIGSGQYGVECWFAKACRQRDLDVLFNHFAMSVQGKRVSVMTLITKFPPGYRCSREMGPIFQLVKQEQNKLRICLPTRSSRALNEPAAIKHHRWRPGIVRKVKITWQLGRYEVTIMLRSMVIISTDWYICIQARLVPFNDGKPNWNALWKMFLLRTQDCIVCSHAKTNMAHTFCHPFSLSVWYWCIYIT